MNNLLQLYELVRVYLNETDHLAQTEALRKVAAKTSEIERERLHKIPDELLMPANGDGVCHERAPLTAKIGDRVRVTSKEGWVYQGQLTEATPSGPDSWFVVVQEGGGKSGIIVKACQVEKI